MRLEDYWNDYTSGERELFQSSCRRLLKSTFLVRDKDEENRRAYHFIAKRPEPISQYFRYMGYDIIVDRDNGVVMLKNCADLGENGRIQFNHFSMKKVESIVLCCLWTLYADKLRSGNLSRFVDIPIMDMNFELEKYGVKELLDNKKLITEVLTTFSRFNLLDVRGKIGEGDCSLRLYPSIQFALEADEFTRFVENVQDRMLDRNEDVSEDEEENDADE